MVVEEAVVCIAIVAVVPLLTAREALVDEAFGVNGSPAQKAVFAEATAIEVTAATYPQTVT